MIHAKNPTLWNTTLVIIGIMLLAAGPVGFLLLIAAGLCQRGYLKRRKLDLAGARAVQDERDMMDRVLAIRSLR